MDEIQALVQMETKLKISPAPVGREVNRQVVLLRTGAGVLFDDSQRDIRRIGGFSAKKNVC